MLKELKYFFYLVTIFLFLFMTGKYYFSDVNKKNSYRLINSLNNKIDTNSSSLITLKNDTDDIIEYVENNVNTDKKKFHFWKLLGND